MLGLLWPSSLWKAEKMLHGHVTEVSARPPKGRFGEVPLFAIKVEKTPGGVGRIGRSEKKNLPRMNTDYTDQVGETEVRRRGRPSPDSLARTANAKNAG
jgi:hypothetical protein